MNLQTVLLLSLSKVISRLAGHYTFFLLMVLWHPMAGQVIYRVGPEHADCRNAIEIFDTVYGPTTAPVGGGEVVEFDSHSSDLYSFEMEHNTVWYTFQVYRNCDLLIDITPLSVDDDYDFILFKWQGDQTCELIRRGDLKPVRSCISRNDPGIGSRTGLSYEATDSFIHSGPGSSYARALPVQKGERYVLVLDNVYPNGEGHTIRLKYRNCRDLEPEKVEEPSNYLNLTIRDASTFALVKGEITLTDRTWRQGDEGSRIWRDTARLVVRLDQQTTYQVTVKAPGYFQFTEEVRTGSAFQTYRMTANLLRIEAGKSVSFSNIMFSGGSDKLLRESYPVLDNIAETLLDQEDIEIEIVGHVNDPLNARSSSSPAHNQSLSERRALAVYNYLIRKGVSSRRLSWSGKSNKEMVYPYAATEAEMHANRRVELIIKKQGINR
jgi:outer membrane protein OmpA-like peptidoglycan-associated protein